MKLFWISLYYLEPRGWGGWKTTSISKTYSGKIPNVLKTRVSGERKRSEREIKFNIGQIRDSREKSSESRATSYWRITALDCYGKNPWIKIQIFIFTKILSSIAQPFEQSSSKCLFWSTLSGFFRLVCWIVWQTHLTELSDLDFFVGEKEFFGKLEKFFGRNFHQKMIWDQCFSKEFQKFRPYRMSFLEKSMLSVKASDNRKKIPRRIVGDYCDTLLNSMMWFKRRFW